MLNQIYGNAQQSSAVAPARDAKDALPTKEQEREANGGVGAGVFDPYGEPFYDSDYDRDGRRIDRDNTEHMGKGSIDADGGRRANPWTMSDTDADDRNSDDRRRKHEENRYEGKFAQDRGRHRGGRDDSRSRSRSKRKKRNRSKKKSGKFFYIDIAYT